MRVTKVIREYIEEKVKEKMPLPEKPQDSLNEELDQIREEILKMAKAKFVEFAKKHKGKFYFNWSGFGSEEYEEQLKYIDRSLEVRGCSSIHTKEDDEYQKTKKEIEKKRQETIKDIIVTLELGGTKAELEEMLAKVGV